MNVSVTYDGPMDGFPVTLDGPSRLTAYDFDDDGSDTIILKDGAANAVVDPDGTLTAIPKDGPPFGGAHPLLYINFEDTPLLYMLKHVSYSELYDPVAFEQSGSKYSDYWDDRRYLIASNPITTMVNGEDVGIYLRSITDRDYLPLEASVVIDMSRTTIPINEIPDTLSTGTLAAHGEMVACLANGNRLFVLDAFGDDGVWTKIDLPDGPTFGPVIADLDRDDAYEAIVTAGQRLVIASANGSVS